MTSVVDPNEVTKFNQIARSYWDPEGPMRALHQINPLRIDFTESFYPLQDAKVLDVGCGGGLASEAMAMRGGSVTAIDASPEMLKTAELHALESGLTIHYNESHAEAMVDSHAGAFDVVTCFEMIEHVPDPMASLAHSQHSCVQGDGSSYRQLIAPPKHIWAPLSQPNTFSTGSLKVRTTTPVF